MRGRRMRWLTVLVLVVGGLSVWLFIYNVFLSSDGHRLIRTVQQFYSYEQEGDYGSAWELFHPQMQAIYTKDYYIQLRAHVFMQQLGAGRMRVELGEPEKLSMWRLSAESEALTNVYRLEVEQHFMSSFGKMTVVQEVFVVKEKESWKLLWSFNE